eukprot:scaffold27393_cov46-Phaeocystis_antarctica.AAC.1
MATCLFHLLARRESGQGPRRACAIDHSPTPMSTGGGFRAFLSSVGYGYCFSRQLISAAISAWHRFPSEQRS